MYLRGELMKIGESGLRRQGGDDEMKFGSEAQRGRGKNDGGKGEKATVAR